MRKTLLTAALGLGVSLGVAVNAQATGHHGHYYPAPPVTVYPCPPSKVIKVEPHKKAEPKPSAPVEPGREAEQRPEGQPQQPETVPFPPVDPTAGLTAGGAAGMGMIGRADQNARFNLFDVQSAIPRTRVWFAYQSVQDYKTGLTPTLNFLSPSAVSSSLESQGLNPANVFNRADQDLYRFGVEYAINPRLSIAAQAQYYDMGGVDGLDSDWSNPQVMVKYALRMCPGSVVSATLGIQLQTDRNVGGIHDDTTAYYPGLLAYQEVGKNAFIQSGVQFRLPWGGNQVYTVDYGLSFGYWLYRHPSLEYGCGWGGYAASCHKPLILGIIPMVELYGKHVLGDATITDPFGFNAGTLPFADVFGNFTAPVTFEEPRNVYDLTVGTQVILGHGLAATGAISFPLTGSNVRDVEYILAVQLGF